MFVLLSLQVCTSHLLVKLQNLQFVMNFTNNCDSFGQTINVNLETDLNGKYSFNKKITLDSNRSGQLVLECKDTNWADNCLEAVRQLKENIKADVKFTGANDVYEKYYKVIVDVDTKKVVNVGLIAGCTVGAAVVIGIIAILYVCKKKQVKKNREAQDSELM
ncbi:Hypothetical_protein [Hexamita inflata]|uniref:Hypothetical_protein n=1 Tax=Hexamita inflata TaxID=28002 RepID=A0AA86RHC2_9EUKA|nr:Hypothetical protein HINF_LOCUS61103 [Hexamita inflata]